MYVNRRRILAVLLPALIAILMAAGPSPAALATTTALEVSNGRFVTLPAGHELGYRVQGHATLIRTDTATFVGVLAYGLDGLTLYPTHVHNAPCSANPAGGGHYQHIVDGPVDAVNEIWPEVRTDGAGWGLGFAYHANRARPDAQSIVIHYPFDTSIRLACAELSP